MSVPEKAFQPQLACPLDGVRVIDLSRLVSGNMVSLQLADFGAEVMTVAHGGARHRGGDRAARDGAGPAQNRECSACSPIAEIVDEVEGERGVIVGTTRLIAMVETAAAFFHIAEIARAIQGSAP